MKQHNKQGQRRARKQRPLHIARRNGLTGNNAYRVTLTTLLGSVFAGDKDQVGLLRVKPSSYQGFLAEYGYRWLEFRITRLRFQFIPSVNIVQSALYPNGAVPCGVSNIIRTAVYQANETPPNTGQMDTLPTTSHPTYQEFSVTCKPKAWMISGSVGYTATDQNATTGKVSPWLGVMANATGGLAADIYHYGVAYSTYADARWTNPSRYEVYTVMVTADFEFRGKSLEGSTGHPTNDFVPIGHPECRFRLSKPLDAIVEEHESSE